MKRAVVVRAFAPIAFASIAIAVASCTNATTADTGDDAGMMIHGAQFFRGPMPTATDGPAVEVVTLMVSQIPLAQQDSPFAGALAPGSTAAAIMLSGDRGYWVVTAGGPDQSSPTYPSFSAPVSFSPALGVGGYDLITRAVDAAGHFGAPTLAHFELVDPRAASMDTLVVSLSWDTESDLDLHLVVPDGTEVFYRNINSWQLPPPGTPVDPSAWMTGGILDFDSNADCVIDGRRLENIAWTMPPPSGHYVVRVDTKGLCGQVSAHWKVDVRLANVVIAHAEGNSLESDTEFNHDRGAGVLALEFDVP